MAFFDKGTENLKKEITAVRKKFDFINLMGQEPTLRKDILELISFAGELGFRQVGVTTNGRMLAYPDFTEKLVRRGLDQAVITVAGHNARLHDSHTGARGSFEQTLAGIKNFIFQQGRKKNLSLVLNVMVTGRNYKSLAAIVDFYVALGAREINIGHILPFNKKIIASRGCVARMKDVVPYLIRIQDKHGAAARFLFVEYPPCVLPEGYRHLSFPCLEESPQKIRLTLCSGCVYRAKCQGIHKYYLDLYGEKEFSL